MTNYYLLMIAKLAVIPLLASVNAAAQTSSTTPKSVSPIANPDAISCLDQVTDKDRLKCYDKLFKEQKSQTKNTKSKSQWVINSSVSSWTGEPTVIATVKSQRAAQCGIDVWKPIELVVSCRDNRTILHIASSHCYMGSNMWDTKIAVRYRVDKQKPVSTDMQEIGIGKAFGLHENADVIKFAKKLYSSKHLRIEFATLLHPNVQVTFPILDTQKALAPVRKACNW